ncbi:MAG TPA: hypothetical protein PK303_01310 [bacterium]|nr:hypothetical protein [bacterium]HPP07745.1 hypothetical protein [bacterium]
MKAGFSAVKITPDFSTQLGGAGTGEKRYATSILDDIFARAMVIESEGKKICFLSLDVTIVTEDYTKKIRKFAQSLGFLPESVMVSAVQNHSAPSLGNFMLDPDFPQLPERFEYVRGGETKTFQFIFEKVCQAVRAANENLVPVVPCAGRAVFDGLAFNRRAVTRSGKVRMPWFYPKVQKPLGPVDIKYIEGPIDPEIGVMCFQLENMRFHCGILHFTCHPVNVFATDYYAISSDWPGAWVAELEKFFEAGCLVANGCCGNVNPWPAFQPDFYPDHRKMGKQLAEITEKIVTRLTVSNSENIAFKSKIIEIPFRIEPDITEKAKKFLEENPLPAIMKDHSERIAPEWFEAASIMSVEYARKRGNFLYEIQAFRIGDFALLGLPGEPFVEGQLEIKTLSPFEFTFIAHATNHYVGYIPTSQALKRGGHESKFGYWSKLVPEALEIIVQQSIFLLNELYQGD